jgi:predicted O-linked N-acetylglucosamine transferase (SPINDLY family)
MDYHRFFQTLPTLYQDWGLISMRPISEEFLSIQTQVNSATNINTLPLLNLAVDCLEEGEIYCQIGCSDSAMLIGSLVNHPEQIAYIADDFALTGEEEQLSALEALNNSLSLFNLEDQVIFAPQNFEEFFADLREVAPETKIGVYFYTAASDYRSQLLSLLLAKPFLSERALITINNSNYGMVQQATYDFLASNPESELLLDLSTPKENHYTFGNGIYILSWNRKGQKFYSWDDLNINWRNIPVIEALKYSHNSWEFKEKRELLNQLLTEAKSLLDRKQIETAQQKLNKALSYNKYDSELWYYLGISHCLQGNYTQAILSIKQALNRDSSIYKYHYDLAILLEKLGHYQEAISCYHNAMAVDITSLDAYNNLGNIYYKLGDLESAANLYKQALSINPEHFGSYMNLGKVYFAQKNFNRAQKNYQQALKIKPNNPDILYNLGLVFEANQDSASAALYFGDSAYNEKKYGEAIKFYNQHLEKALGNLYVYQNLAKCYAEVNLPNEVIKTYQKGIATYPKNVSLYSGLLRNFQNFGMIKEAIETAEEAINNLPNNFKLLFTLEKARLLPIVYNSPEEIDFYRRRFADSLVKVITEVSLQSEEDKKNALEAIIYYPNFYLSYQGKNDLDLQIIYGNFISRVMAANYPQWANKIPVPQSNQKQKIRIGYVSYCFHHHVVGKLAEGWVKNHNNTEFEVYCYYLGSHTVDEITERFKIHSTVFRQLPDDNLEKICQQIIDDNLHILIYLDLGMYAKATALAGLRLAPIQCTTWLHPVTSGLPTIDYFLSSDLMEPENGQEHYSEKLIRLANLGVCSAKPSFPEDYTNYLGRKEFNLDEQKIVYLSSQSVSKYLPQHDYIFPAIAQRVNQCQFVFVNKDSYLTEKFQKRLEKAFADFGLNSSDYCVFVPQMNFYKYLNLYPVSDIFLDTLSFSGFNTTLDAIAFNLPVVTCPGEVMRARQSSGILRMLGVEDTIAQSEQEYIDIAVRLGIDTQWRKSIAEKIRTNQDRVFGDKTSVAALEQFFQQVVAQSQT